MQWSKLEVDSAQVKLLASRYRLDLITSSILVRRGLSDPQSVLYLIEDDFRYLHNPFCLPAMTETVNRIMEAIDKKDRILVFGDRDVDGVTSTALMVETLENMGASVSWKIPESDDSYGLTSVVVEQLKDLGANLLITVDCGITAITEIASVRAHGIDVIVVDHHEPTGEIPDALVVNPKLANSSYPFIELSACAVVWKLSWALRFARTDLFGETICLLNARPLNDSIVVEAVKLTNLKRSDTLFQTIYLGSGKPDTDRFVQFTEGCEIFVYDTALITSLLSQAFGPIDLFVHDLASELTSVYPGIAGKSLLQLREGSKLLRYAEGNCSEIDLMVQLFTAGVFHRYPRLLTDSEACLDLVALSTVADLMPLRGENRILVKRGLSVLSGTTRVGLRELLGRAKLYGKKLSARDISFQLAPVLNAAGRMGEASVAANLLLATDEDIARSLTDQLQDLNRRRRIVAEDAWKRLQLPARESYNRSGNKLVWVIDKNLPRGITGIIASKLLDRFHAPSIVMADHGHETTGSVRTVSHISVPQILEQFDDLLVRWGGHSMAGGFNLNSREVPAFIKRLELVATKIKTVDVGDSTTLSIDAEIPPRFLTPKLWEIVDLFAPYGFGHEPLVFLMTDVPIIRVDIVGRGKPAHVKLLIEAGGYRWPALFWNAAEQIGVNFDKGDRISLIFQLTRSYYRQVETLQLNVMELERK